MKIEFEISSFDSLGQGVSKNQPKQSGMVTFITKVLPGEKGQVTIHRKAKGVQFAQLKSPQELTVSSPQRITPECSHFNQCNGCHFLHTNYATELELKVQALQGLFHNYFKRWGQNPKIKSIAAESRLHYRNRLQLHYDLKLGKLGLINSVTKSIVEIPECQILVSPLKEKLLELYGNWKNKARAFSPQGHVEIYWHHDSIKENWNLPYAAQGFTQVNQVMNQKLQAQVLDKLKQIAPKRIVELFSGDGNLTRSLSESDCFLVDSYPHQGHLPHQRFNCLDLQRPDSLEKFSKLYTFPDTDLLLLDPPRSGLTNLALWVEKFQVKQLLYVSCNPSTLLRDVFTLGEKFQLSELILMDLFPGTYHFETVAYFSRKD